MAINTVSAPAEDVPYELIYWPGVPGRGEHIRLLFEEAGVPYIDRAQEEGKGMIFYERNQGDHLNPPPFAPPVLQHGDVILSQTPNILSYLGPRLNLVPNPDQDNIGLYHVNQLALTALDGLSNETHDVHHPVSMLLYYEDQLGESKRKAQDYTANRIPKFLGYFEKVLKGEASGDGPWLYGGRLTYAGLGSFPVPRWCQVCLPKDVGILGREWQLRQRIHTLSGS
ncbi:glutathione S-transferase [Fusarium oxysporum f. sp. conglutinans race 2 54008]|uniref:GST N-terminal domain-containing protein n=4 Tax=Fusarium oxysporum TaxID=5507 RepID=A0A8H6LH02_FUSOX|nr:hypothetical protein FOXB_15812 [Fusarium oxysporum f. sp. conglutinans Fo5176]EXA31260.1 glutathione S-transferase [Fusarium oxysporum f. sp. pisi HDV247]EXL66916.1 glutathione S-transferase [Fusarium oxysporum f. sp. conglutinans race 2 54008]KAF6518510.1 hypothetical protein HZS61_002588 [Fusarium oxysporum f. sp. conglutinans]KAG6989980.1 Glutathione S-transferase [Fusarium oxysporum f. sp. conglutinans]